MAAKRWSGRQFLLLIGDIGIILSSFYFALWFRTGQTPLEFTAVSQLALVVSLILSYAVSFYIFELYDTRRSFRGSAFLASMGGAFGLAFLFSIISSFIFQEKLGRAVLGISWALTGALACGWRLVYGTLFRLQEPRRNVLILGNGETTETVIPALTNDPEFRLKAILDKKNLKDILAKEAEPLGQGTLEDFVEQNGINDIVVSFEAEVSSELERALVNCRMKGIGCYTFEAFYERLFEKLPVLMLNDRWFLMSGGFGNLGSKLYQTLKRVADSVIAALILIITFPLSVLISILIPLTSKGPIFFTQQRLGEDKAPFKIIKFRTMVRDAEADGPQWAQNNDLRVTRLGGLLRKARLDEIPQLLNVLKGEMSLIGPRPEREHFVAQLTEKVPFYALRF
ncbi:MAG TPA: sugar transferase, partial [Acidobacteriota bacterium]|nr:sugar transferase [Acidobacteriota bacterium]